MLYARYKFCIQCSMHYYPFDRDRTRKLFFANIARRYIADLVWACVRATNTYPNDSHTIG